MHVKGEKNQCHGPWESCQESSLGFISSLEKFEKHRYPLDQRFVFERS